MSDSTTHLFVYGTLRPGDVRWHLLEPFVADDGAVDHTVGSLYDTGRGYPAATFGGAGVVHGLTYRLRIDTIGRALAVLDEEEGTVAGLYRRVQLITDNGVTAWAYEYGTGLELSPIASGDWFNRA